jgi:hypothetical protein
MLFALLLLVSARGMKCPGSSAAIHHASCQVTVTFQSGCDAVYAEMVARIHGENGWVDPHNRGTYAVVEGSTAGQELHATRHTGNGKYTDKMVFTYSSSGSSCVMTGCSESQVLSFADFGTNFCNLHDLYCGAQDQCAKAATDLTYTEVVGSCTESDKGKCKPKAAMLI